MDKTVKLNDIDIAEYGLYLASIPTVPTPEQDIEYVEIRGRHGSLTKKYGFKDIPYQLEFFFFDDLPFKQAFRQAKTMLFSAKTMIITDDPTVYYKIKSLSIETAENDIINYGRFIVNITLDPFQYEVNNPTEIITSRTTINNPGYEAEPVMTAHCNGTGNIYINDQEITIQNINGTITIDSEMQNAYRVSGGYVTNLNKHMIGKFPILEHGSNVISFDGDISKIELIKNWRWV